MLRGRIGIALGSGGARGFAHVGVLKGLAAAGITPDVICGASAGALVGAVHAAGRLDEFEDWARKLDRRTMLGLLDVSFSGGALRGRRVIEQVASFLPEGNIETALPRPFGAVATDLESGREIWLRRGPLVDALHASSAIPGVVSTRWRSREPRTRRALPSPRRRQRHRRRSERRLARPALPRRSRGAASRAGPSERRAGIARSATALGRAAPAIRHHDRGAPRPAEPRPLRRPQQRARDHAGPHHPQPPDRRQAGSPPELRASRGLAPGPAGKACCRTNRRRSNRPSPA
ncbi:MAG: patatin-like phospholipase family protein [Deltaproteobacteria bacterium]|nr:patatin-like phospholipase family protein [Deltaproteobacteria bacterium]